MLFSPNNLEFYTVYIYCKRMKQLRIIISQLRNEIKALHIPKENVDPNQ